VCTSSHTYGTQLIIEFMRIHNKFKGTKGFISIWERVIRFRYMITEKAKRKARIITFFDTHGLQATKDAYGIGKTTIYRWKQSLLTDNGKLECLNDKSKAPKNRRSRKVPEEVIAYIIEQRKLHYRIGKKKLSSLLLEDLHINYSESKVGRILTNLKTRNLLPTYSKVSMYARSGQVKERIVIKRKKLRRKDYKPDKSGGSSTS